MTEHLRPTPWDKRNFSIDTYEVISMTEDALLETDWQEGHYTIKVDPLKSPEKLLDHGFYYMDTLIEPECMRDEFVPSDRGGTFISEDYQAEEVFAIAEEAFVHGRFHRDFNIPSSLADLRYMNWVKDLHEKGQIFGLFYEHELAGFYGYEDDKVLLLGIKKDFRNKGLAKAFASKGCLEQFRLGHDTLRTSISAANVASLNLFYSLGFRLKHTVDVYHKLNGTKPVEV
ncbi:GNAT family N-acetyltransferase [Lentibacillus sp. Marseille-P4043]|uniref:GNAT family N-acetyltransferase n=1 Tax=Lentibacillus sp. Marseille-P4043 TaxID=2040293 RepID=UPI000D0ABAA4|nr:N-acetyltransferase [Lentibacillus sp. Marseille-P4043]